VPKKDKTLIGRTERVTIVSGKKVGTALARIDTGATLSSIDTRLAAALRLGPIIDVTEIKSANGTAIRAVVRAKVKLGGRTINGRFTLSNRSRMKYQVLIGRNLLQGKFVIDPSKRVKKR